jgi:hypothetical protein
MEINIIKASKSYNFETKHARKIHAFILNSAAKD